MSDLLLDLGRRPLYRRAVRRLGLPLPMPQALRRAEGPWQARPLSGRTAAMGGAGGALEAAILAAGASVEPGAPDVLAFDAGAIESAATLRALYDFFHPRLSELATCGRVLVVAPPPEETDRAEVAAARTALDGFVRSVAKEIGRKGATAHLVYVSAGAEERLAPLVAFLASDHAAFLTGQPWRVTLGAAFPPSTPVTRALGGKTALVTGAARGIGAATARALSAEGAHVVCVDRPLDDTETRALTDEIAGTPLGIDVTHPDAPATIVREVTERFGGLDILVNNAGITRDKTLGKMPESHWEQVMAVNLEAVVRVTEALVERGLRDHGRVVCLSSVAGLAGNVGQTNYAASKAAVAGYARALAPQVAGRGITVNAIAPGFIETRLTAEIPVMQREAARRLSALGQGGEPRDVADLVTFLASPGAAGITGEVVRACGGMFVGA